jgi:uncharacterized protein (TIGR00369 family)
MTKVKTRIESICRSRKIVMPEHINPHGTLFGGVLMAWMDKISFMCAQNYAECTTTPTACVHEIEFMRPAMLGQQVLLQAQVIHTGNSSMFVEVKVETQSAVNQQFRQVAKACLTFVALNELGLRKMFHA